MYKRKLTSIGSIHYIKQVIKTILDGTVCGKVFCTVTTGIADRNKYDQHSVKFQIESDCHRASFTFEHKELTGVFRCGRADVYFKQDNSTQLFARMFKY